MIQNSDDLRVRRTKKLLREAFIALIQEHNFGPSRWERLLNAQW